MIRFIMLSGATCCAGGSRLYRLDAFADSPAQGADRTLYVDQDGATGFSAHGKLHNIMQCRRRMHVYRYMVAPVEESGQGRAARASCGGSPNK